MKFTGIGQLLEFIYEAFVILRLLRRLLSQRVLLQLETVTATAAAVRAPFAVHGALARSL